MSWRYSKGMKRRTKLVIPDGYYVHVGVRDKKRKHKKGADYKLVKKLRRKGTP